MKEILKEIKKKCDAVKNNLQREILKQFYLANIPVELNEIERFEILVMEIKNMNGALGNYLNEAQIIDFLVSFLRTKTAFNNFGYSAKNAISAMKTMSKSLPNQSSKSKKDKNWKTKIIWDRVN